MIRTILALAALPVAAVVIYRPSPPQTQLPATAVMTEGVRAARQDASTFRLRWSVVGDMPPATVIQHEKIAEQRPEAHSSAAPIPEPKPARLRRAPVRLDLCQRHRMHKVWYGRRWRCRR